jgi:hypothetical protein
MPPLNEHIAKRWIESKFPEVRGPMKAMLIITFGAGFDWGMKEAQDIVDTELKQINIEWNLTNQKITLKEFD